MFRFLNQSRLQPLKLLSHQKTLKPQKAFKTLETPKRSTKLCPEPCTPEDAKARALNPTS